MEEIKETLREGVKKKQTFQLEMSVFELSK